MQKPIRNRVCGMVLGTLICFSNISCAKESDKISDFARNVTLHVLFHELAHGLIREFELPVLANEEAMADSFATIWVTRAMQDQAPGIITARVQSWLIEDSEVSSDDYDFKGEHLLDIRRAYQAACLFYGLSPVDYDQYVQWLDFSERDLADCSDTAPDQGEAWVRLLKPYNLPLDKRSKNVDLIFGEGPMKEEMQASGIMQQFVEQVELFDWPKGIVVHFDHCDRGASWSRTKRRILLCDDYVQRFIHQGNSL